MAYISRSAAGALIPEQVASEIIQDTVQGSAVLQLARKTTMSSSQTRIPIMVAFPDAYWVSGDTGQKQTSSASWSNQYIYAEELAVIVPIPENVLADASYDLWGEVKPRIVEAFGQKIDQACLFGVDAPASWPTSISEACDNTDNEVKDGTGVDLADDISATFAKIEEDGFAPNGVLATVGLKHRLRNLRDSDGSPIYLSSLRDDGRTESIYGEPLYWQRNGSWEADEAVLIAGDWSQALVAIRQDITYKLLDQATLTDGAGNVTYSLAEQDMVALRAVMRLGFFVRNPKTRENPDDDTRYPFAVLRPSGWVGTGGTVS